VNKGIAFVVGVSLMNAVSMMIVMPVLPRLVESFTGGTAGAAHYVGLFATVFALVQFMVSPFIGSLSDRYGRRAIILASAFGQSVNFAVMGLASNLGSLLFARIVAGISAGSLPAVNAYIADVVPAQHRAASYGWVTAANSAGFLLGPALGGVLGEISPRLPFWVAASLCVLNVLYGAVVLRESLAVHRRKPVSLAQANPLAALRFLQQRPAVTRLTLVYVMLLLAQQCMPNTIVLYTDYRFGWSVQQIGVYLTAVGVAGMVVQALVIRRFVARFGERAAMMLGFVGYTVAFVIYASAPVGRIFVLAAPFFALGGFVTPAVLAQVTRCVASDEQGRLQGALAAVASLCGLFTPLLYTQIFGFAIGPGHDLLPEGAHMYVAAAFLAAGALLSARYIRQQRAAMVVEPGA
jgi:DHA1 family tetracycline resistance protein-like MFS transporter